MPYTGDRATTLSWAVHLHLPPDLIYLCPQSFLFCFPLMMNLSHAPSSLSLKTSSPLHGTIDLWRWSWGMWLLFLGPSNWKKQGRLGKHLRSLSPCLPPLWSRPNIYQCISVFTGIMTQLVCVKLPVSLIRQEVLPTDGLKTQEVDISMPGIPALCSLCRNKEGWCITQEQCVYDQMFLTSIAQQPHICMSSKLAHQNFITEPHLLPDMDRLWTVCATPSGSTDVQVNRAIN